MFKQTGLIDRRIIDLGSSEEIDSMINEISKDKHLEVIIHIGRVDDLHMPHMELIRAFPNVEEEVMTEIFFTLCRFGGISNVFNDIEENISFILNQAGYNEPVPHEWYLIENCFLTISEFIKNAVGEKIFDGMLSTYDMETLPPDDFPHIRCSFNIFYNIEIVMLPNTLEYNYYYLSFNKMEVLGHGLCGNIHELSL